MSKTLAIPARMSYEDCARNAELARRRATRRARAEARTIQPQTRGVNSPFDGADINRLLAGWVTLKMHPDDESRYNIDRLKVRARDLERNSPLARNYLRLLSVNAIGPHGIGFEAQVKDNSGKLNKWVNTRIEDGWSDWADAPTLDGKMNLATLCRLSLKTVARDGEIFFRKWRGDFNAYGFALEAIDPDQVDHLYTRAGVADRGINEIRMGVEVDVHGKPVAYWMWDRPERTFTNLQPRNRIRVPAEEIIHLYDPDRINQTRGITWFAPVMVPLRMLEGYREAELVAARISAASVGFFERTAPEGTPPETDDEGKFNMDVPEAGTFNVLPEGYKIAQFHAEHPSTAFPAFVKDQIRAIATGLGVSYNGLTSDLESVNYSSMRSGLLIERELYRTIQQWWIAQFMQPVYRDWLNSALLVGAVKLDSRVVTKFLNVRWSPRGWAWVDPLKDTEAAIMGIQTGMQSRTQALAEQGVRFEEVLADLADETKMAVDAKVDIAGPVASASGTPKKEKPLADEATPGTSPDATGPEADPGGRNGTNGHNRLQVILDASRTRQSRWRRAGLVED